MAVKEILQLGNPLLRTPSSPVEDPASPAIEGLIGDLRDTLAECRARTTYGRAIAAPQIGVLSRVVFLNVNRPWPLINPKIVGHSDEKLTLWDACLSYLSIFFQVSRSRAIEVRYQNTEGEWQSLLAEGALSELLQHEIDHLDGVLAIDRIVDIRTLCTREEFERRYRAESPYA